MAVCMEDWLGKKGSDADDNDEMILLKSCSHILNVPHKTKYKHVVSTQTKRRQLGQSVVRKLDRDASCRKLPMPFDATPDATKV